MSSIHIGLTPQAFNIHRFKIKAIYLSIYLRLFVENLIQISLYLHAQVQGH